MNIDKYTWDLTPLYKSDNDPQIEKDIKRTEELVDIFVKKWKKRTDYYKDPKVLYSAFKELEDITISDTYLEKPFLYVFLRKEQEETNSEIKTLYSQIHNREIELNNKMQFFSLNIMKKIPKSKQKDFLNEPLLKDYTHSLYRAFQNAKHVLSDKEESIINKLSMSSYSNWVKMVSEKVAKSSAKKDNTDLSFESIIKMTQKNDKKTRDWAGKEIGKILKDIEDSAEYELNSVISSHNTISKLHKHKSFDHSRHISDDIDSKTVQTMVDSVSKSFELSNRYYKLFTQILKQKNIGYHERAVDISKVSKEYSYEDSIEIVKSSFSNLDNEFTQIVEQLHTKRLYDVFPKKGKGGGAFCISISKNNPTYILLNHTNTLQDVLTLAHESGHAIHAILSQKHQHPVNSGHTVATAEVASTFFEDFTLEAISKDLTKEGRFNLLQIKLADDISTIFRQVACYNLELDLHSEIDKKTYISKEEIGELFVKNMASYMGDSVRFDDSHKHWWIYWSHIRRPFYVYSYASGLLISKALQKNVRKDPKYIDKVKKFLSAGTSKSTKDIFLDLGIDISKKDFWLDGLAQIEDMLNEFESLGKELGKFK